MLDRALLLCALAVPSAGLGTVAHAQPPGPVRLDWRAPDGCPGGAEVRAAVDRLLGGAVSGAPVDVDAEVARGDGGFTLTLTAGESERTLRGSTCRELADAAALIVAMMVDPRAALANGPSPEPEPLPAPDEPELSQKALASSLAEPEPGREAPVPLTAPRRAGGPHDSIEDDAPEATPLRWHVAAAAVVEGGSVPGVGVGPALTVGLDVGPARLEAHGRYLPGSRGSVSNHDTASGDVSLLAAGARACLIALEGGVEGGPCAGLEAGSMRAEGHGISSPGEASALWAAATVGGWLTVELAPWLGLRAEVRGAIPVNRPAFVIDGVEGEVHRPAPVAGHASIGAEVRFR